MGSNRVFCTLCPCGLPIYAYIFFLCKYVYILTFDLFISVSNCVHTDHILQIYDPLIFTYTLG